VKWRVAQIKTALLVSVVGALLCSSSPDRLGRRAHVSHEYGRVPINAYACADGYLQ